VPKTSKRFLHFLFHICTFNASNTKINLTNFVSYLKFLILTHRVPGIESQWGRDFPPVQTGPEAHPASCTTGTGSVSGVKCGRSVLLTTHSLLAPRSWKNRAIPLSLPSPLGHNRACNEVTLPLPLPHRVGPPYKDISVNCLYLFIMIIIRNPQILLQRVLYIFTFGLQSVKRFVLVTGDLRA
jgi:hypothetical protein